MVLSYTQRTDDFRKQKFTLGIFEYLTIIFIVLKLTGLVDFTWWQVFSPKIIGISIALIEGMIEGFIEAYQKNKEN